MTTWPTTQSRTAAMAAAASPAPLVPGALVWPQGSVLVVPPYVPTGWSTTGSLSAAGRAAGR